MPTRKLKLPFLSQAEEARIQRGIEADPDNPEWTTNDFRRAKPFAEIFPQMAESRAGFQKKRRKMRTGG